MIKISINDIVSRFVKSLPCMVMGSALLMCGNGYAQDAAENPAVSSPEGGEIFFDLRH